MKPRIRYSRHVWSCACRLVDWWKQYPVIGYGYTPKEAYEDWRAQL